MNIEEYIVFRVNALLHAHDARIVMRLEGGMSNYTYVVECQGKKYTYRVPGKFAEYFVDRDDEWANILEVEPLGLNNVTTYVEIRSGDLVKSLLADALFELGILLEGHARLDRHPLFQRVFAPLRYHVRKQSASDYEDLHRVPGTHMLGKENRCIILFHQRVRIGRNNRAAC